MWDHCHWMNMIKNVRVNVRVKAYGTGAGAAAPQFGQFVDMNSGRESTLLGQNTIHVWITQIYGLLTAVNGTKSTNLEYVTAVNGKILATPQYQGSKFVVFW